MSTEENQTPNDQVPETPAITEHAVDDTEQQSTDPIQSLLASFPKDEEGNDQAGETAEEEPSAEQPNTEQPAAETSPSAQNLPERKKQNVRIDLPFSKPTEYDPEEETVVLPADFTAETQIRIGNTPRIDILSGENAREWAETVAEGIDKNTHSEVFVKTLEDETADFRQGVDNAGSRLIGGVPKLKSIENQKLSGERAIIRLMSHLGLGSLFTAPLWHSGIWITFKAPSEAEILELNRILVSDKIRFGRYSYGLAFSNTSAYTTERLVGFALDHVYETSLLPELSTPEKLREIISAKDTYSLLAGFAATMYPRGFQYRRPCISDPGTCNYVLTEKLDISKLLFVNNNGLTDWQKTHMSVRQANRKDLASVTRYQEEMHKSQPQKITVNEGMPNEVKFGIRSPSLSEYIDSGFRWIGDIVALVDNALTEEATEVQRNAYITEHGQAAAMRQYAHWVESVEFGDGNEISDRESIENSLNMLSADDSIREGFMSAIIKFINESTISVVGIPVYDCPECGKPQEGETLPLNKNIIPLDVFQVFLDLVGQKLQKIAFR